MPHRDDQEAGVTARDVIGRFRYRYENSDLPDWAYEPLDTFLDEADAILSALRDAGYVIVNGATATKAQGWGLRIPSGAWTDDDQKHMEQLSSVLGAAVAPGAEDAP